MRVPGPRRTVIPHLRRLAEAAVEPITFGKDEMTHSQRTLDYLWSLAPQGTSNAAIAN